MSGMWKRSHGRTSEAPPDERGGYRYARPTATAPHLDSTLPCRACQQASWYPPLADLQYRAVPTSRFAQHDDRVSLYRPVEAPGTLLTAPIGVGRAFQT